MNDELIEELWRHRRRWKNLRDSLIAVATAVAFALVYAWLLKHDHIAPPPRDSQDYFTDATP